MKTLEAIRFDFDRFRKEAEELRRWLGRRAELGERKHILPFFRKRPHLAASLACYGPFVFRIDRLAFEYPLFGDFTCDLVAGDSTSGAYCLVEFEDAGPNSLFVPHGKKATREWSPRFEHGFGQIIDWFCLLEDLKKSDAFAARFGARSVSTTGLLVVGRDQHLRPGEKERLEWRRRNVVVASQHVHCVTFDGLLDNLLGALGTFRLGAGG